MNEAAVAVAVAGVGATVWWVVPAPPSLVGRMHDPSAVGRDRRRGVVVRSSPWLAFSLVPGVLLADVAPRLLLLVLAGGLVLAVGMVLHGRRARRQGEYAAGLRVHEACRALADELRSGSPPATALTVAAEASPELAGGVRAAELGADVPAALRGAASHVPQLRWLAASWQVSQETGAGLAEALDRLVEQLDRAHATRRVVTSELASARATARLLVGLPVVALVLASGSAPGPWVFLLDTAPGRLCLFLGLGFELLGLWWIESIAASVERRA